MDKPRINHKALLVSEGGKGHKARVCRAQSATLAYRRGPSNQ